MADDAYIVASEPYGLVEVTAAVPAPRRRDAGQPRQPHGQPRPDRGPRRRRAGTLEGIERLAYDGTPLPVADDDIAGAQITTRDIDRGDFPHFLLKEITESPASFRKTLRGKLVERDGALEVGLGPDTLPDDVRAGLRSGAITGCS